MASPSLFQFPCSLQLFHPLAASGSYPVVLLMPVPSTPPIEGTSSSHQSSIPAVFWAEHLKLVTTLRIPEKFICCEALRFAITSQDVSKFQLGSSLLVKRRST
ncbi:hypothetical protein J6590_016825 [Homalodisca vitripennis]|nr:hypothetical protein J6590_016825 [Homalodisca vitripennis]